MNIKSGSILKFNDSQFVSTLSNDLVKFGRVKVAGLGVFVLKKMKGRKGFNIGTNTIEEYPPYNKITFSPTLSIKEKIKLWK